MKYTPNIFQLQALEALKKSEKTEHKGIVVLPTGVGKTFLSTLWFAGKIKKKKKANVLFICHSNDILSQANEQEFQKHLNHLHIEYGYYNGEEKNISQATFATVQTLHRNLDAFCPTHFDYIIVDEAHHYQAKTFREVLLHFTPKYLLGLTATPNRRDNKSLFEVCGNIVYSCDIHSAIKEKLLSKLKYYFVDDDIDFSKIKSNGTEYNRKDMNKKLCIPAYDKKILSQYKKYVKQHKRSKTICFCATTAHAHRMAELFNDNNIPSVSFSSQLRQSGIGGMHTELRTRILKDYRKGHYDVIFVVNMFNEGVDVPKCDMLMFLRPTESSIVFTQQLGRGLRKSPGKDYVLVLDFCGNARKNQINLDVINEAFSIDVKKKIKLKLNREYNTKEFHIETDYGSITFNQRKMDMFRTPKRGSQFIGKEMVIQEYRELEKKHGGPVPAKIYDKISKYGRTQVLKHWPGYSAFKTELGSNQLSFTKPQMIQETQAWYKKNGKWPTVRDRKGCLITDNTIRKHWPSYADFLKECGKTTKCHEINIVNKKKLDADIKKILKKGPIFFKDAEKKLGYSLQNYMMKFYGHASWVKVIKNHGLYKEYKILYKAVDKTPKVPREMPTHYKKILKTLQKHHWSSSKFIRKKIDIDKSKFGSSIAGLKRKGLIKTRGSTQTREYALKFPRMVIA